jgi:beta-lactamase class A
MLLGAPGCSSDAGLHPPLDGGQTEASVPVDAATAPDAGVTAPDSPVGQALTWVLSGMNGAKVTAQDADAHFAKSFLSSVPASQITGIFTQLAALKHWTLVGFDGAPAKTSLVALLTNKDAQYWRLTLNVDSAGLIDGLFVGQAADADPELASFAAVDARLAKLAPNVSVLAASIDNGACTPLHALAADTSRPLGSQFKLYILAALTESVKNGTHAWTDQLAIDDKLKSLPSGTFQNQAAGTKLAVSAFAENMISISDNTAADHLLFFVGRTNVEAALAANGHHAPAENQPFLSTRELFDMKLLLTDQDRAAFIASTEAEKRTKLQTYDDTLDPRTASAGWTTPIAVSTLEWFATPTDLCKLMANLKAYGDAPATAEVKKALSINPGIADDAKLFSYIGFKGGSEPGVLTLSFLLQRKKDQAYRFYSVELMSEAASLDEDQIIYVAGAGRALLGK